MNNVYTDKKFGETLHVREVVALHPHMNVGEAPGITPERNEHVTDPKNGELDMLFLFDLSLRQPLWHTPR